MKNELLFPFGSKIVKAEENNLTEDNLNEYSTAHKRILLYGSVQGVGFREWIKTKALSLGLFGYCRNKKDGSVEVLVGGPAHILDEFVQLCKAGPPKANVEKIKVVDTNRAIDSQRGFRIKRQKKQQAKNTNPGLGSHQSYTTAVLRSKECIQLKNMKMNIYDDAPHIGNDFLTKEFAQLDCQVDKLGKYVRVDIDGDKVFFDQALSSNSSLVGVKIIGNKPLCKVFFSEAKVSVAKGKSFKPDEKELAKDFALNMEKAVLKPSNGSKGKGVTVGISSEDEFEAAWQIATASSKSGRLNSVLIEEQFLNGIEARYLVVGNKCMAVVQRVPPNVIGNGTDTIEKLILKKNETRAKNPNLHNKPIKLNQHRISIIESQGFKVDSIPQEHEMVLIDWKAGLSTGGDSLDITDDAHWQFKEIAERAASAIPGIDIIGVDILANDHCVKPLPENYIVIEANVKPGLGGHHFPVYGQPRRVAKGIAEYTVRLMKARKLALEKYVDEEKAGDDCYGDLQAINLFEMCKKNEYLQQTDSTSKLLSEEFREQGYKPRMIKNYLVIDIGDERVVFKGLLSTNMSNINMKIIENKYWLKEMLNGAHIPTRNFEYFKLNQKKSAKAYASTLNEYTVSSCNNKNGQKIEIPISSKNSFEKAWTEVHKFESTVDKAVTKGIIIEEGALSGIKARYLVVDGQCVGVVQYMHSNIEGRNDLEFFGETFAITKYANLTLKGLSEKTAKLLPSLDIVAVEIMAKSHIEKPLAGDYQVVDVKTNPDLGEFHFPLYGEAQNVSKKIVEYTLKWASQKKIVDAILNHE